MHPTGESRSRVGAQKPCGAAGRGGEESARRSSDRVFVRDAFAGFRRRATRENQVRAGLMKRSALAAALCALVISSPAEAAPMHGFSDDPRAFEQNGSEALAAGATANRVVVGWREQPSDLAPAVAAMGGATPIISLNTIRADTPPDAYAASCARFAEAYPQAIIGTLNEPNIPLGARSRSRRPWRRSTPARMPSTPSIPHRSCSAQRLRR